MTKIAIIEDDHAISQMYRMKFEAEGFDVRLAHDGEHGINLIKAFRPDLVLLDLQMPEMTGTEALKVIRKDKELANLKVVILTNTGREEAPSELAKLNPTDYFVKAELTPSQVVARVQDLLKK